MLYSIRRAETILKNVNISRETILKNVNISRETILKNVTIEKTINHYKRQVPSRKTCTKLNEREVLANCLVLFFNIQK